MPNGKADLPALPVGQSGEINRFLREGMATIANPAGMKAEDRLLESIGNMGHFDRDVFAEAEKFAADILEKLIAAIDGPEADIGLDEEDGRAVRSWLLRWLRKDFASNREDAGEEAGGGGELPDNIVVAIIQAKRKAEQLKISPRQLLAFLAGPVASAMSRFRRAGESPERIVDLFVEPAKGRIPMGWSDDGAAFVKRMARYLETQRERDSGYYGTYAQLATLFRGEPEGKHALLSAILYHRVLVRLPEEVGIGVMAKTANNLAGRLMTLLRVRHDDSDVKVAEKASEEHLRAANRVHALAAVCSAAGNDAGKKLAADEAMAKRLSGMAGIVGFRFVGDGLAMGRKAMTWLTMTNVLGAWHCPLPDMLPEGRVGRLGDDVLAPLATVAALCRIELLDEDGQHEIASGFANASNMAGRGDAVIKAKKQGAAAAALAGLGLWWALRFGRDADDSLLNKRGLSAALRLLARIDDLQTDTVEQLTGLPPLVAWLKSWNSQMSDDVGMESMQMQLLLNREKFDHLAPLAEMPKSTGDVAGHVAGLVCGLLDAEPGDGLPPLPLEGKDAVPAALTASAMLARRALDQSIGTDNVNQAIGLWEHLVDKVVSWAENPAKITEAWRWLYGPEPSEGESSAMDRLGATGPLVAIGEASAKEWADMLAELAPKDADPGELVIEFLNGVLHRPA